MLFNSIEFLVFLPVVFLLYWLVFKSSRTQNFYLVIASYVFYGWLDWRFLFLIAFTTLCTYYSGILIDRFRKQEIPNKTKKYHCNLPRVVMLSNLILNLSILGIFKYYNFFAESVSSAFGSLGYQLDWVTLDLLLPVGISFYTFQALSYTLDVYNRKMEVSSDPISFFAFVSFFPQLLAGPIGRASNLLPQYAKLRKFDYGKSVDGMRQILWGFFKKMVVADNCAIVVNQIWGTYQDQSSLTLFLGAALFTFQIYGDFSGYSDIAIGTARLFGIDLMRNFNFPYFSRDIAEFWRRWHISLTSWFRDYIYIPLGGSRVSKWKSFRNTMIIFLVSGLWHGANWTFIIWGAYHALLFLPLLLLGKNRRYKDTVAEGRLFPSFRELLQMITTFLWVTLGWIVFKSESIQQAISYIWDMCTHGGFSFPFSALSFIYILLLIVVEWSQRNQPHALYLAGMVKFIPLRWGIYYAILFLVICCSGHEQQFIYFQF